MGAYRDLGVQNGIAIGVVPYSSWPGSGAGVYTNGDTSLIHLTNLSWSPAISSHKVILMVGPWQNAQKFNCQGNVPTITAQPQSQTIAAGGTATLSVGATNGQSFQWYQGLTGNTAAPVPGGNAATIYVSPSQETFYWVRVSSNCSTVDSNAADIVVASNQPTNVSLQTFYGNYWSATACGGSDVNTQASGIGSCERFTLTDLNGGSLIDGDQIHLQAASGKFVTAENGGYCSGWTSFPYSDCQVNANRDSASYWETFVVKNVSCPGCEVHSGDLIALISTAGTYLSAEWGGANGCNPCNPPINANRSSDGEWEHFIIWY